MLGSIWCWARFRRCRVRFRAAASLFLPAPRRGPQRGRCCPGLGAQGTKRVPSPGPGWLRGCQVPRPRRRGVAPSPQSHSRRKVRTPRCVCRGLGKEKHRAWAHSLGPRASWCWEGMDEGTCPPIPTPGLVPVPWGPQLPAGVGAHGWVRWRLGLGRPPALEAVGQNETSCFGLGCASWGSSTGLGLGPPPSLQPVRASRVSTDTREGAAPIIPNLLIPALEFTNTWESGEHSPLWGNIPAMGKPAWDRLNHLQEKAVGEEQLPPPRPVLQALPGSPPAPARAAGRAEQGCQQQPNARLWKREQAFQHRACRPASSRARRGAVGWARAELQGTGPSPKAPRG